MGHRAAEQSCLRRTRFSAQAQRSSGIALGSERVEIVKLGGQQPAADERSEAADRDVQSLLAGVGHEVVNLVVAAPARQELRPDRSQFGQHLGKVRCAGRLGAATRLLPRSFSVRFSKNRGLSENHRREVQKLGMAMKLQRILCWIALGIAGLLALIFLLDLILKWPFYRFSIATDILVILASALIIWQSVETLFDL